MKNWIIKNKLYFIGGAAGAILGFLYYTYIGCVSGTCAITSSPVNSTIYFAAMGALFFNLFKKQDNKIKPAN